MAFRADDVQAACVHHGLVFGFPRVFQRFDLRLFLLVCKRFVGADGIGLVLHVAAQHDVCTATCHVGGDGNHFGFACLGDNQGFALVFFGVQYVVRQAFAFEQMRHEFGVFNCGRAHQHGLSALVAVFDVFNYGFVFFFGGAEDLVVEVFALDGLVGGDDNGFQAVDGLELVGFSVGGACHAR